MQHQLISQPLVGQEHELLSVPDFLGSQSQQLATRCDPGCEEVVCKRRTGLVRIKVVAEKRQELSAPLPGEHATEHGALQCAQVSDALLGGVVQVCDTGDGGTTLDERRCVVGEVLAVALHLGDGVQMRPAPHA